MPGPPHPGEPGRAGLLCAIQGPTPGSAGPGQSSSARKPLIGVTTGSPSVTPTIARITGSKSRS